MDRIGILFEDEEFARAVSEIGIFASSYQDRRNAPSELWTAQGYRAEEMGLSLEWIERIHPDDQARVRRAAEAVFSGATDHFEETFRLAQRDGSYRWIVSRGRMVERGPDREPLLFLGVDTDISRFKTIERRLRSQNEELETLREVAQVLNASLNLEETISRIFEQTQRVIPFDTATVQLLDQGQLRVIGGYGFRDIEPIMQLRFAYPEDGSLSTKAIDSRRPIMSLDVTRDFPAFVQPDEKMPIYSWIGIPLVRHGEVIGLLAADAMRRNAYEANHLNLAATVADHVAVALENARLHDETFRMAMSDDLTRVGSRRRFDLEGRLVIENARRTHQPVTVLMIDIDRFKVVNDTWGHPTGDIILKRIAETCSATLRSSDVLARYGGEEFVILLTNTDSSEGMITAERIRATIEELDNPEIGRAVTVSIGLACAVPDADLALEDLVACADRALYEAKEAGRNRAIACPDCRPIVEE